MNTLEFSSEIIYSSQDSYRRAQLILATPLPEPVDLKGEEFLDCVKWAKTQGTSPKWVKAKGSQEWVKTSSSQNIVDVFVRCNEEKQFWKQYQYVPLLEEEVKLLETGRLDSLQLCTAVLKTLKDG